MGGGSRAGGGGKEVELLWASPDCTHFSKAKGGKPLDKRNRALAWAVYRWAERVRPRCVILENVEEFRQWGPLTSAGRPDKRRQGDTFRHWRDCFLGLGYRYRACQLRACDYGAPTTRRRLFVLFHLEQDPVVPPPPLCGPGTEVRFPGGSSVSTWWWRGVRIDLPFDLQ